MKKKKTKTPCAQTLKKKTPQSHLRQKKKQKTTTTPPPGVKTPIPQSVNPSFQGIYNQRN
jgi:hypothetical protein